VKKGELNQRTSIRLQSDVTSTIQRNADAVDPAGRRSSVPGLVGVSASAGGMFRTAGGWRGAASHMVV